MEQQQQTLYFHILSFLGARQLTMTVAAIAGDYDILVRLYGRKYSISQDFLLNTDISCLTGLT